MSNAHRVAVIGAGPAGLMAAEVLTERGIGVDVYDAMPSFGRKFLMAGKSGLNITHAGERATFLDRYICNDERLKSAIERFDASDIVAWMREFGIEAHKGPTGRVFPNMMKASPLLRAWLQRLSDQGAVFHTKHRWEGWVENGALKFMTPGDPKTVSYDATLLALGGASWRRLGSDGAWTKIMAAKSVRLSPFGPSNCGFLVNWSDRMRQDQAGQPVKACELSVRTNDGVQRSRSEFVITERGVESGGVYMLSAALRTTLQQQGEAVLNIDLCPDIDVQDLAKRLAKPRGKKSFSNHIRKVANITGPKLALIYEFIDRAVLNNPDKLAAFIKHIPVPVIGHVPIDEAISTSGGVAWSAISDDYMLKNLPGVFCAGEMLDWDAPTGGYLITACMATGRAAGLGLLNWLYRD